MWPRKRLDIGWGDLAFGSLRAICPANRQRTQSGVERSFSDDDDVIAALSVRSAFDLLLSELDLPSGSEILMSAVTIPDMVRIVEQHGLIPVPIDVEIATLAPHIDALRRHVTPASRAVVVAHLFGTRIPLEPILEFARDFDLLVVED